MYEVLHYYWSSYDDGDEEHDIDYVEELVGEELQLDLDDAEEVDQDVEVLEVHVHEDVGADVDDEDGALDDVDEDTGWEGGQQHPLGDSLPGFGS